MRNLYKQLTCVACPNTSISSSTLVSFTPLHYSYFPFHYADPSQLNPVSGIECGKRYRHWHAVFLSLSLIMWTMETIKVWWWNYMPHSLSNLIRSLLATRPTIWRWCKANSSSMKQFKDNPAMVNVYFNYDSLKLNLKQNILNTKEKVVLWSVFKTGLL